MTYNIENCKNGQCSCPPRKGSPRDWTKVEMVMTNKTLTLKDKSMAKVCAFEYPALSKSRD